jgi:ElaB/YqjD/DUF883 family membrane-anchored ribosome-binding protein
MSEAGLRQLEREVELARARLASDLALLRSPDTMAEFTGGLKEEVFDTKDALIEKARATAQSAAENFVQDVKARAAANPAAALAIGAGIGWQLLRHPPIATALVGAGLYSLFRSSPVKKAGTTDAEYLRQAKENLRSQAQDALDVARERGGQLAESAAEQLAELKDQAAEKAHELSGRARDQAGRIKDRISDAADDAWERISEAAGQASATVSDTGADVRRRAEAAADVAMHQFTGGAARPRNGHGEAPSIAPGNDDRRNTLLLGFAGLAVAAALRMAYERRAAEPAE